MLMMDVYYAVCRFCCCCPDNSDHERQQDWRQQKKDIEYVLHQQDINASSAQQSGGQNLSASLHPNSVGTPTHSAKSSEGATAGGANNATASANGGGQHGEEESHLLKEVRSSSLKTEMYRQIWQRRVLWFGQTLPSFESRSTIEFWSGWTSRPSGQQQSAPGANGSHSATTPPTSSTTRRKKYHLTPEVSIESLQPELYAQTSVESMEGVSMDAGLCGYGDVDLHFDGPIEATPLGQIHFSLIYDDHKKILLVKIVEACHLPLPKPAVVVATTVAALPASDAGQQQEQQQPAQLAQDSSFTPSRHRKDPPHSNPYVRVYLLPDQRDGRQTPVQRKTQNPVFNHGFTYELAHREVLKRTLMLKVQDLNRSTHRHHVIGQVLLPLSDLNLIKGVHIWKRIRPTDQDSHSPELGEILVSLTYLPSARRLNLDLLRGKQLLQTNFGGSVPYVRVSLVVAGKHIKTKKSSRKRNTIDPVWGETISFNVAAAELPESSLVVSVWDFNGGIAKDDFIGRIVLSAKEPSGEEEMSHWNCILSDDRSSTAYWHTLRSREECDQISPASVTVC
ncbi:synaptotagmin-17-like isoform X1 [Daphnia pulicaria]|uniref:synaptotagmin-17-like isoform X1 n=1 Tax=Daphnia pulicaria TaxID=35523 RepID=UPI001EEBE1BC|nr:synaptotagmin-17-like isoform X1 [Daphnia pulicaria]